MASKVWELRCLPLTLQNPVPSDIEIARSQTPKNVLELTQETGLLPNEVRGGALLVELLCGYYVVICFQVEPYGSHKAKVSLSILDRLKDQADGK